jgi:RHS repeat-associated protein
MGCHNLLHIENQSTLRVVHGENESFSNSSTVSYRYGFNGMEKDDEHTQGKYDFGARIYDGRLGRWLAIDPRMQDLPGYTPYNFVANNPMRYIDPDGKFLLDVHQRITQNALANFTIKFDDSNPLYYSSVNYKANNSFEYGMIGLGTRISGGVTYPDLKEASSNDAHFDGMDFTKIQANLSRIEGESKATVNSYKKGQKNTTAIGHKVGRNLHAIQDLYTHSNFVELYAKAYPDQKDISKIPTLREALNDPQYATFAVLIQETGTDANGNAKGLHTGEYPGDGGSDSHKSMNHDLGAGAQFTSVLFVTEVWGKEVDWFSRAAEAVATKATTEHLNDVKDIIESKE